MKAQEQVRDRDNTNLTGPGASDCAIHDSYKVVKGRMTAEKSGDVLDDVLLHYIQVQSGHPDHGSPHGEGSLQRMTKRAMMLYLSGISQQCPSASLPG